MQRRTLTGLLSPTVVTEISERMQAPSRPREQMRAAYVKCLRAVSGRTSYLALVVEASGRREAGERAKQLTDTFL